MAHQQEPTPTEPSSDAPQPSTGNVNATGNTINAGENVIINTGTYNSVVNQLPPQHQMPTPIQLKAGLFPMSIALVFVVVIYVIYRLLSISTKQEDTLSIDPNPNVEYYAQLYNCDDVCELFASRSKEHISQIYLGDPNEKDWEKNWKNITNDVRESSTLTLQVSNGGGYITYGIHIIKRDKLGDTPIVDKACGVVRTQGCPAYGNPRIGPVVQVVFPLEQSMSIGWCNWFSIQVLGWKSRICQ